MSNSPTSISKKTRRSRKRRTAKRVTLFELIPNSRPYRFFQNLVRLFKIAPFFAGLPLVLLFASTGTDYYVALQGYNSLDYLTFGNLPTREEPDVVGRAHAEAFKSHVQSYVYVFVLFLGLLHLKNLIRFFKSVPILIIIVAYLATTAIQSFEPGRVLANSSLVFINILAAAIFAINQQGRENRLRNFYLVVFIPFFFHQLASLVLFYSVGIDIFSFIVSGGNRLGGFSGNPNTLSAHAIVGTWSAMSLLFVRNVGQFKSTLCLIALVVFIINILLSGSGTGLLVSLILVTSMLWFNFLSHVGTNIRVTVNLLLVSSALLAAAAVVFFKTPGELFIAITDALGKESTLTGRTELWEVARQAIAEKFWFGWGYDYHESVLSIHRFTISHGHFHNGFLDSAVAGGISLVILLLFCFYSFFSRLLSEWRSNYKAYPLAISFVVLMMMNLSEYTILRPNSQLWLLFLCSFCFVAAWQARIGVLPESTWFEQYPRQSRKGNSVTGDRYSSRGGRRVRKRKRSFKN